MDGLMALAADFRLEVVEDAAESLGSFYRGVHTGTISRLGTLSFNGNKVITTGGGGAILTNDPELARRAKHLTTTAKTPHRWEYVHDELGYNYRMPNINAALGCAQLERLHAMLEAKRRLFAAYQEALSDVPEVDLIREPESCRSNYWLQAILLRTGHEAARDAVLTATNDAGLMTRPVWRLLHRLAPFAACPRMDLPGAEAIESRLINIPSSASLPGGRAV
jgi:dTDP-4-amino-4,6-dideoxygalactose transaminase